MMMRWRNSTQHSCIALCFVSIALKQSSSTTHTHTPPRFCLPLLGWFREDVFFCIVLSVAHYCCFIFNEVLLMPFCTNLVLLWLKWQRSGVVPEGYDAGIHQRWQKWASLNTNRQRPGGFLLDGQGQVTFDSWTESETSSTQFGCFCLSCQKQT